MARLALQTVLTLVNINLPMAIVALLRRAFPAFAAVARSTSGVCVRARQFKMRQVVIEVLRCPPGLSVVARFALIPEAAFVRIGLAMTAGAQ